MSMQDLAERFRMVDTTAICDADKTVRTMSSAIRPRSAQRRICGAAFTVRCRDDFLAVLRAVETASPGDVIVVDGGGREIALAGELFARGALARGLGGIIIDGGYRDIAYVSGSELAVYSRFVTPMAGTVSTLGDMQVPVTCGGVTVNPGDIILADEEGLIVVAPDRVDDLLDKATAIKEAEGRLVARLNTGATLSDVTNLDQHVDTLIRGEPSSLKLLTQ